MKRWFLFSICCLTTVVTLAEPPNIVFFFIDDMGWQDTSEPFHSEVTALNKRYRTPNMQRLARDGMKFTQAYACSVCSPSRISLMTGMNAARHKVTNWTLHKNKSPDRNHPKIQPPAWNLNGIAMEPGTERTLVATTLPSILRDAGYRTIHVGKAHFAADGTSGEDPCNLGFDVNIGGHCAGGPGSYLGKHDFSAVWRKGARIWDVPGLEAYHGQDVYLTEAHTIEAKKAVTESVEKNKPFYLYLSHYAVHAPWEPDSRFMKTYTDMGLKGYAAIYASMIEGMDTSLGDIMDHLAALGVEENTVVVFMTDNGCPKQLPPNKPLRGHKISAYEGGARVPLIVKWPGVVKPGSVCRDDYVIIEDVFPTFLEMAGVSEYKQPGGEIDGISWMPLLKQEEGYPRGRSIFWHFPHTYDQPAYSSVRQGDWKLIYWHASRKRELFNLKADIGEQHDQASSHPEKLETYSRILGAFLREVGGQMTIDKVTGEPVEYPDQLAGNCRPIEAVPR